MKTKKGLLFSFLSSFCFLFLISGLWAKTQAPKPEDRYYENEIIRFTYPPDTEVHEWKNVVYLTQVGGSQPLFVVFPQHRNIKVKGTKNFYCRVKTEPLQAFKSQKKLDHTENLIPNLKPNKKTKWCYTQPQKLGLVSDITLFPNDFGNSDAVRKKLKRFQPQSLWLNYEAYQTMTRADFLALVIRWRYPNRDFSSWRSRCFKDINLNTPHGGVICWAKEKKIVQGIYENFHPDSSVNIWAVLQILTRTFEVDLFTKDLEKIPPGFFPQMSKYHIAAPLLGGAWSRGVLLKPQGHSFWANRAMRQSEILQILTDFQDWKNGRTLRLRPNYKIHSPIQIFHRPDNLFDWKIKKKSKSKYETKADSVWLQKKTDKFLLWNTLRPNIFEATGWLPIKSNEDILSLKINYDAERVEGEVELLNSHGEKIIFRPKIPASFLENLKEKFKKRKIYGSDIFISFLRTLDQGPRLATIPEKNTLPIWDIYLSALDFKTLFISPTSDTRYRGFLETEYGNIAQKNYSIRIKTRGNSTRGYLKPSFTIENFEDFGSIETFLGDAFLDQNNEVKLRSFINEPTFLREKLFYQTLRTLGGQAPEFFQVMVRINRIPFGVYQVTEPIKKPFFARRGFKVKDYFYAQNLNAKFNTNLKFHENEKNTLAGYKIRGEAQKLLELIENLEKNNPDLIHSINQKSVFDYALLVWVSDSWDSLTHNFYIFWDLKTEAWNLVSWDADLAWGKTPYKISLDEFDRITRREGKDNNALIYYVFSHLSRAEKQKLWDEFWHTWDQKVDLIGMAEEYQTNHKTIYQYDNHLWNGRFLERPQTESDSFMEIEKLMKQLEKINLNRI